MKNSGTLFFLKTFVCAYIFEKNFVYSLQIS